MSDEIYHYRRTSISTSHIIIIIIIIMEGKAKRKHMFFKKTMCHKSKLICGVVKLNFDSFSEYNLF